MCTIVTEDLTLLNRASKICKDITRPRLFYRMAKSSFDNNLQLIGLYVVIQLCANIAHFKGKPERHDQHVVKIEIAFFRFQKANEIF